MPNRPNGSNPPALCMLDMRRVRPGDILLTRVPMSFDDPATWASHMIQKVTKSPYSHAALCVEPGLFIEAVGTGVGRLAPIHAAARSVENIRVLRPRKDTVPQSATAIRRIATNGATYLHQGYSKRSVPSGKVSAFQDPRRAAVFCAQLVARAFEEVELSVAPGKKSEECVPGDLLMSPLLQDITADVTVLGPCPHTPQYYLDDMSLFERAHHWEIVTKLKILCNYDVRRILDGFNERPASFWEVENILTARKLRPLDEAIYRGLTWYRFAEVYLQKLTEAEQCLVAARSSDEAQWDAALIAAENAVRDQERDREQRSQEYRAYAECCAKHPGKTFTYLAELHGRLLEFSTRTLEAKQQYLRQLNQDIQRRDTLEPMPTLFPVADSRGATAFV
jgi:hypothetical protein